MVWNSSPPCINLSSLSRPPGYLSMKIVCVKRPQVCLGSTFAQKRKEIVTYPFHHLIFPGKQETRLGRTPGKSMFYASYRLDECLSVPSFGSGIDFRLRNSLGGTHGTPGAAQPRPQPEFFRNSLGFRWVNIGFQVLSVTCDSRMKGGTGVSDSYCGGNGGAVSDR